MEGYRPEKGQLDREGEEVEDRIYNAKDFDRTLVLDDRTKLTAKKITEFLKESGDRFQKTIVFCVDQEHAARMRQALINENADLVAENHRYVMRITGSDKEGQDQLGNFIDPESKYPVLVTTSRLLSTGVDAQTCRLIVLDREVGSMTEFKQIVGRGTRVHEDTKKFYLHPDRLSRRDQPFRRPGFRRRSGADLRAGRRRSDRAARRRAATGEDGDPCRQPGADETVVDQPGLHAAARRPDPEDLCRWRRRPHHRRARRISRRERQARHRIPARLHQDGAEEALRQPRRLPQALEIGGAQAGDHRGTGGRGPAARRRSPRNSARTSIPSI